MERHMHLVVPGHRTPCTVLRATLGEAESAEFSSSHTLGPQHVARIGEARPVGTVRDVTLVLHHP